MNTKIPISIFIIAKNEESRIGETLIPAITLADEVIVIDSGSTDRTQQICEDLGAKFIFNAWNGYGLQKRFGEEKCKNKWLLNLDADERLSPELVEELRLLFKDVEPKIGAWKIPRTNIYPGETKIRKLTYNETPIRLYRLECGRFSESPVHDRVILNVGVDTGILKNKIYHYSTISLGNDIQKYNAYTDLQVRDMENKGRKLAPWRIVTEFPLAFLKAYFLRLYFLRGRYGYLLSMNYAIFRHLRMAKHFERRIVKQQKLCKTNSEI